MRSVGVCFLLAMATLRGFAVDSVVVFNEIHYHPATNESANEWVELHNQMAIDIDLSSWSITGDIGFTFAEGTIIPGGGYLVVASDPLTLQADTGLTNVAGPFTGRLNNSLGTLHLRDRNNRLMDAMEYRDGGKWPVAPDGSGATLAKRNEGSTSGSPDHWTSSVRAGGTPGFRNFPATATAQREPLIQMNSLWRYEASGTDLSTAWRAPNYSDASWSGRNAATLISYWPFDGDATAVRGTNGVLVGGATPVADRNGVAGGALAFNGVSQYVSVTNGGGLNGARAGTISLWVKWSGQQDSGAASSFGAVLGRQQNAAFSDDIICLNNANPDSAVVQWRPNTSSGVGAASTGFVSNNVWRHIAVTFTETASQLYLDGVPQTGGGGGALHSNPATMLSIGAWAGDGACFATASIDDVAIWDSPLSAAQIAQLAAQTKTPLDFAAPESAVYYAGDGRIASNDELRRTMVPLGPTTYYFRQAFVFQDDPLRTQLTLDFAADDGAVFYLNGAEIYRHNMPGVAPVYSTLAASAVGDAPLVAGTTLPGTNLVQGTNLFAVEVHQAAPGDLGMVFGAALTANVAPPPFEEERTLIARHDAWKFEASGLDLGALWRAPGYDDFGWPSGSALFSAGSGQVDGVPAERITGLTATASTEYVSDSRLAINTVNGSGLVGNAHVNTPAGAMWLNNGTIAAPNDLNPQITFDLGAVFPIRWLKVWNYNEDSPGLPQLLSRGVASADILVGITNAALTNLIAGQSFNKAPGTQTDFSQLIDLGGVSARYVKLDKLTNFPGGDGRLVGLSEVQFFRDADLNRTQLPLGPTTYYLRKTFYFGGDPARAALLLNAAVDDGAVFYLNNVEIRRLNMPPGAVAYGTLASNAVNHAVYTGFTPVSAASLVHGTNVLAVELHQSAVSGDLDAVFGAELIARMAPVDPAEFDAGGLRFNEISAASSNAFQIEFINVGEEPLNTAGYTVQRTGPSSDVQYALPAQNLMPGQLLAVSQPGLNFGAAAGDKLFLHLPGGRGIADAVEVHERPRARSPDGAGEWVTPVANTPGASNSVALQHDVVINEIMYHGLRTLETTGMIGTNVIIPFTNSWRYEQSGTDLSLAWRAPNYDDSAWLVGAGLFYYTTNNLPAPKNTELTLGPNTYYFRTTFVYTGAPAILSMSMRHVVDDGIVVYLNGKEIHRFNMPAGAIVYTNNSSAALINASIRVAGAVAITNLVLGTNVLAVEVHQAANNGNDAAFGLELTSVIESVPKVPFSESPEQWVELFNRSTNAVDLTGWRLDEAIDFRFASNTFIPPRGYLVVAKDPPELLSRFPGINVVGPYANSLSHRGDRIVLRDAADNPANAVHYFDDGRWPEEPDAGGASLELRDPHADNSAGEAWAASIESGRSSWRTYTYRGVAAASPVGPDGQWHEFVIGLLDAGEALLDDIMVIETPSTTPTNLIQNSTFTGGTNTWRIIGNHHGEVIDDPDQPGNKVLRLVATGNTEHMSNHGETTFVGNRDVVNGREYLISFRAKWISGCRQLHTRLYFNRLPHVTVLDAPALHGTPGSQNSTFTTNIGPTYASLGHAPPVPAPFAPVTVSIEANHPDGIATMTLAWRTDGGTWNTAPMTADVSVPQQFTASIPGKPAGTVVQFYVQGTDAFGAISTFPAGGTNSRALFKVDDFLAATNGLHNFRLVTLAADADDLLRTVNLMSNERIGCTLIHDEREIIYDLGLRLKGSEHSRTTTPRLGFNVSFPSEQLYRGIHGTVAIDRSESTGFGQREMLVHQMLNHAGGVPTKYHDLIQVMAPRPEYTGSAELQLARYSDVFLDDQYDHGSDGTVFEYELVYLLNPPTDNGTPEGNKVPNPDSTAGTTIRNLGDDKEFYRWNFLIKNNEQHDDYSRLIPFAKAMELAGTNFFAQITNIIDVGAWLRGSAVNVLSGCGDSYGGDGSQHNVQFYVRPEDSRIVYFPHDMDAFFSATRPILPNADLTKLIGTPAYARTYYCDLLEIIDTTCNAGYMARWADHFQRLLPAQNFAGHLAFITQRANFVTAQVNSAVPNVAFSITSNGGNDFGTTNSQWALTGTAPLTVKEIVINGVSYPILWTGLTTWSVLLPLTAPVNMISSQGVDRNGNVIGTDSITITNTGTVAPLPVVINEWMASNLGPGGFPDPADGAFQDWIELFNPNLVSVDLSGFYLTDQLSDPGKWRIPSGTVIPGRGFLLVWADNEPAQNGAGDLHASFQLNNGGEAIGLYSTNLTPQHEITFTQQVQNVSQGLFPDGNTNSLYFMTNWTPRRPNQLGPPLTPQIANVVFSSGGHVGFSVAGSTDRAYRIEFKNDLNAPAWTPLSTNRSVNGAVSISDVATNQPQRFYRVTLLQ